ncbi:hypothetical protein JG688_00018300 [Phytophthora aleatoria]|uniref:Uncharacterized protein n=1 Tax=Phytophthora aleatoria TaxID=2496075 RepID=A0A8J5IRK8_9STRA|nr:hypothetical protein JG688_00018300 [Phytophthora aleatoria]
MEFHARLFASLLRVQSALQMLYRQYKTDDDFPKCLHVLGDTEFCSMLKKDQKRSLHRCRMHPLKNSVRDPKKKLLISPKERDILRDARNTMFTPSPQRAQDAGHLAEDSDEEYPGDSVRDAATLALWGEYLDEVFQEEELDIGYTEAGTSSNSTCRAEQDYEDDNEFEEIHAAVIHEFPIENVSYFPQEVKLSGFKAQKATLEELFAVISTLMQPHD